MAPALTSPSFRLYWKPELKSIRATTTTAAAQTRQNLVSFGKPMGDGSSSEEAKELDGATDKANRFFIDLRKIPDAKSLVSVVTSPSTSLFASPRGKDTPTVSVAGATGQAGARIA